MGLAVLFSMAERRLEMIEQAFLPKAIDQESEIEKIIRENDAIHNSVSTEPRLKQDWLLGLYAETAKEYKALYDTAARIDNLEYALAPIETGIRCLNAMSIFYTIKAVEVVWKAGFWARYFFKTRDKQSIAVFAVNEAIGIVLKYGSLVNLYDLYKTTVRKQIRDETARKYCEKVIG
ncbi:MAG: hypothetical protein V1837_04855 [Candidatus Woesearchaeota archaeon]